MSIMSNEKWADTRRKLFASVKEKLEGKTIKEVTAMEGTLFVEFTDGTTLEVGSYLESQGHNDSAALSYDIEMPQGEPT